MNVKSKNRPKSLDDLVRLNIDTTGLSDVEVDRAISISYNSLSPRSKAILVMRVVDGMTQVNIGKEYNITPQRVRDIYEKSEHRFLSMVSDYAKSIRDGQESINALVLSEKVRNALIHAGIRTISELEKTDFFSIPYIRGIGPAGMREIIHSYRNWLCIHGEDDASILKLSFKEAIRYIK